jgi:branched-chain amino acid transport system
MFVGLMVGAIGIGVVFLLGSVGEIITEKSGHLNLGIPGVMCMGMAGGCVMVVTYMKGLSDPANASYLLILLFALFGACLFAAAGGAIYAFLTVTLRTNQNVVGLALTTFGAGFSQFIMNRLFLAVPNGRALLAAASVKAKSYLPFADSLGAFGKIFLSHGILVYFAIALAIVAALFLKKTKAGLRLRAVGENPGTADAVGINVTAYKYGAILIGSAIAGLGGLFYVLDYNCGTFDNTMTIQAFGWLAIALVIFTMWKPDLSILGSIVFGALYILGAKITGLSTLGQQELIKLLPYIVTIIVLILTSIFGGKTVQPPAALGTNYFREER